MGHRQPGRRGVNVGRRRRVDLTSSPSLHGKGDPAVVGPDSVDAQAAGEPISPGANSSVQAPLAPHPGPLSRPSPQSGGKALAKQQDGAFQAPLATARGPRSRPLPQTGGEELGFGQDARPSSPFPQLGGKGLGDRGRGSRHGHRHAFFALLALATCVAFLAAPRAGIVRADGALQVTASPQPVDKFPGEADFSISASSSATIAAVTLHFILLPDTTETAANADFTPGTSVQATYVMRTAGNPLYVPPMKTIRYYWTLQDSAGNQVKTDPVDWQYLDTRFNFKTATNGNLTLYYHAGSDADAQRVLQIGRQAIDKAQALDGVTVPYDVRIVAYQT